MKNTKKIITDKQEVMDRYVSRRQFLYGAGSALMLPTLVSMMPSSVSAAVAADSRLRLCMMSTEFGMYNDHLTGSSLDHPKMQQIQADPLVANGPLVKHGLLSELSGNISYIVDAKLAPYKSDVNLYAGLDHMCMSGHHAGGYAGANGSSNRLIGNGRSIDLVIEESAAFKGSAKGSLPVIRQSNDNAAGMSFNRNRNSSGIFLSGEENCIKQYSEIDDAKIFGYLFGNVSVSPTIAADTSSTRRKWIVDKILPDYNSLRKHRRISGNDIVLLDQYINSIFEIQSRLTTSTTNTVTCSKPTGFTQQFAGAGQVKDFNAYWKNIFSMTVAAFICDQSRILVTHNRQPNNEHIHGDLIGASGLPQAGSGSQKDWINVMVDYFVKPLKETTDPFNGGSLLDNTLIVWQNEHRGRDHETQDIPIFTIGRLGTKTRSGYIMDYRQPAVSGKTQSHNIRRGFPLKMMMVSIMQAMGVTPAEHNVEGDGNGYGYWTTGSLGTDSKNQPNLMSDFYNMSYFGTRHSTPLPFFTKA